MTTTINNTKRNVMTMAWSFVKKYNYHMAEALRLAWANVKLHIKMVKGVATFTFKKKSGEIRHAVGTLRQDLGAVVNGNGTSYDHLQAFYDTEISAWRSYIKANLIIA